MLSDVQWELAKDLFDAAVDWPVAERADRLQASTGDPAVRAEVSSLLAALDATEGLFSLGAMADLAAGLADTIGQLPEGTQIGAWRIVRLIGHGGVGSVYEAARVAGGFDQRAALKIIQHDAAHYYNRYADERQIVARLDHPHIARIYDGGLAPGGQPYMAIELVEGVPITVHARAARLDLRARLRLIAQVCDAVDYAHRNLVLHLDIKPGNVLVTRDGLAKLVDFGAGRSMETAATPAPPGMFTPAYAAPEQVAGGVLTTASDVFALGKVIAELVGAQSQGSTALRSDIAAIVAHATASDPAGRYASAGAVKEDIARALAGEPLAIRRDQRGYVVRRVAWQYRGWIVAGGALVASLVVGVVATAIEARRAILARDHLQAEVSRGDAVRDYLSLLLRNRATDGAGHALAGPEILSKSAENLGVTYAHDPLHYAQITEYLMRLFADMTDEAAASALGARFLASHAVMADPATTARIRYVYAGSLMRQGQMAPALAMLETARGWWLAHPDSDRADLVRSLLVKGQILRAQGDGPGAIAALRDGLAQARVTPGMNAEDVPNFENSLALPLAQTGRFDDAEQLLADARRFREREGRTDDALLTVIQNQGAVALAKGDLTSARALLTDAVNKRRAQFGPSAAMGAAQMQLAQVDLITGHAGDAHAMAAEAKANALRFAGAQSPLAVQAGVLLAAAGATAGTSDAADAVSAALAATAKGPPPLRALALAARARHTGANGDDALALLQALGPAGARVRPLVMAVLKR
jgi:non-specific serine/threonine protein kinase/serine/threonine-protein kinase